ncbi:MAG: hypothetical protein U0414_26715 [Polyangiaceae bacterium]
MLTLCGAIGCGTPEKPYEKKPDPKEKAEVPPVPNLPPLQRKNGDAWTVHGLIHDFRSMNHHGEVEGAKISIGGYIVKTNLVPCADPKTMDGKKEQCVPVCAVHHGGLRKDKNPGDPEGCKAPQPSFWIGDTPDAKETILVVGFASTFAQIHDVILTVDETDLDKRTDKDFLAKIVDTQFATPIPIILPAKGAKVKVTGTYGSQALKGSGTSIDPNHGILTYESIEYIEEAPELASLPGMKPRKVPKEKDKKK